MSIIIIHEVGHFLAAMYYRWNVDKIYIYPYGGYSKFNDAINKPMYQEFVILLMGPIFQTIYYYVLLTFGIDVTIYHFSIIIFNFLPIYPLDGGKLLSILISSCMAYKKSLTVTFWLSYVVFFLFFCALFHDSFSLSIFSIALVVFCNLYCENKKKGYYFNKFLLERYLGNYRFKKVKYINSLNQMRKERSHYFYSKQGLITEKEMLSRRFKS